jgi:hypothetical protein
MNTMNLTPRPAGPQANPMAPCAHGSHAPHAHTKLDRFGIWVSTICAVHCLLMPFVLVLFPLLAWAHWTRRADLTVFTIAALIGLLACLLSLRHHREWTPLSLVITGIILSSIGRFAGVHLGPLVAQTLLVSGPLLMGYGMWKNQRLCGRCATRP